MRVATQNLEQAAQSMMQASSMTTTLPNSTESLKATEAIVNRTVDRLKAIFPGWKASFGGKSDVQGVAYKAYRKEFFKAIEACREKKQYQAGIDLCIKELTKKSVKMRVALLKMRAELTVDLQDYSKAQELYIAIIQDRELDWAIEGLARVHILQKEYNQKKYPFLRYFLGDVRNKDRLKTALNGVDIEWKSHIPYNNIDDVAVLAEATVVMTPSPAAKNVDHSGEISAQNEKIKKFQKK